MINRLIAEALNSPLPYIALAILIFLGLLLSIYFIEHLGLRRK